MSTTEAPATLTSQELPAIAPLRFSLRLKLASFVATLVIITASLVIAGVYYSTRKMLLDAITDHLSVMASDRGAVVREYIDHQLGQADQIASRTRLRLLVAEQAVGRPRPNYLDELKQILLDATKASQSQLNVSLYKMDGSLIVSTNEKGPSKIPLTRAEIQHGSNSAFFDDLQIQEDGSLHASVSSPLLTRQGQPMGILIARVDASPLMLVLKNLVGLRQTGEILIGAKRQGRIHYLLPDRQGRAISDVAPELDAAMSAAVAGKSGIGRTRNQQGKAVLAAYQPLNYRDWGLIARIDEEELYAPLHRLNRLLFSIAGALLVFGSLASYFLARQLTRPLAQLADSATRVAAGNLDVRVPVNSQDELGTLASAFNHMTEELATSYCDLENRVRNRTEALQHSEHAYSAQTRLLQSMLDGIADGVVATNRQGEFLIFNPAATRMIGIGATDKPPAEWTKHYGLFHPDRATPYQEQDLPLVRAMRGEAVDDLEVFIRNPSNPEGVLISVNASPLLDDQGTANGAIVVFRDITTQRLADETLKRTANELSVSNKQLKQYADELVKLADAERLARLELEKAHDDLKRAEAQLIQSEKLTSLGLMVAGVAHEINNPLSFISNNLAVLQRDVGFLNEILDIFKRAEPLMARHDPELLAQLKEFSEAIDLPYTQKSLPTLIDRSREGLRRIEQIVRDLRDFARVDPGDFQETDLNQGLRSSLNIIQGRARNQGVTINTKLEPLPPVLCQPGKINQVLLNLLVNALDASKNGDTLTLRSRPEPGNQGVLIEVEDTGSGISPKILKKIFDPFFTTKAVGKGTGLGLSISYGIIASHGGTLEVNSVPEQGSTFTIRLPLVPPRPAPNDPPASQDSPPAETP